MKTRAAGQSQLNATVSTSDRNGHCLFPRLPLPLVSPLPHCLPFSLPPPVLLALHDPTPLPLPLPLTLPLPLPVPLTLPLHFSQSPFPLPFLPVHGVEQPGCRRAPNRPRLPDWISHDPPSEYWPAKPQTRRALAALCLWGSLRPFQAHPVGSNELRQARRIGEQTSAVWRAERGSGCQAPAAVSGARRCRAV